MTARREQTLASYRVYCHLRNKIPSQDVLRKDCESIDADGLAAIPLAGVGPVLAIEDDWGRILHAPKWYWEILSDCWMWLAGQTLGLHDRTETHRWYPLGGLRDLCDLHGLSWTERREGERVTLTLVCPLSRTPIHDLPAERST